METWKKFSGTESDWDTFIKNKCGGDFRQAFFWGNYLEEIGWNTRRVELTRGNKRDAIIQYSFKKIWPVCAIYLNGLSQADVRFIPSLIREIKKDFPFHLLYIRFDSHDISTQNKIDELKKLGFRAALYTIRNKEHSIFNLEKNTEEVLKNTKQKWRYNYKKALKKNINLEIVENIEPEEIFKLSLELSKFKKIRSLYSLSELFAYQKHLKRNVFIVRAKDKNFKVVGYYICIIFNGKAYQVFNAVNKIGNQLMAGYRVLMYLHKTLKKNKIKELYLGELNKKRYPGNYQFKSGFNQKRIQVIGEYDYSEIKFVSIIFNLYLYLKNA